MMCLTRFFLRTALAALALSGCGDDDGAPMGMPDAGEAMPDASAPLVLTDIDVSVTSDAAMFDGRVLIGAFRMDPPTTPPVSLSRLTAPSFPLETTLRDVEPGEYFVIGVLDFDPPSPTIPGPEDPTTSIGPLTVDDSGMTLEIDLNLPSS